jgi:hypothetical protein
MASIISAGTTSATALNMSADTTGILQLASNNGTVGLTLNTSQNVGIGTASPAFGLSVEKDNGSGYVALFRKSSSDVALTIQTTGSTTQIQGLNSALSAVNNFSMQLSGGNVGIGFASPAQKLSIAGTVGAGASDITDAIYQRAQAVSGSYFTILHSGTGLTGTYPDLVTDATAGAHIRLTAGELTNDFSGSVDICAYGKTGVTTGNYITFSRRTGVNTIAESGRFENNGNLLVGSATNSGARIRCEFSGQTFGLRVGTTSTSATAVQFVYEPSTQVGGITTSTSSTSYITSSDYRLKEDVSPMVGALAKVQALKPVTYKWKIDGSSGEGFIAHELAEVCPHAVSGEKDAVNEDGSINPQGIDTSFLVATLTAAIQELNAKVTALENK